MKKIYAFIFLAVLVLGATHVRAQQCTPIKFAPGRAGTVIKGNLGPRKNACYKLHARDGQRMTAHVSSLDKRARLYISPDEYDADNLQGADGVTDWEGELTSASGNGNFNIMVSGPQAGATFTLEVAITPTRSSAPSRPSTCGDFSGVYQTDYGPLLLTRTGNQVRGSYRSEQGENSTVAGTVQGRVLNGTWIEPGRRGTFRFELNSDGRSFTGTFKNQGDRNVAGDWNGQCNGESSH
jgi:hypothetical protein